MICPACGVARGHVLDSRLQYDGARVWRRRECPACRHRWSTVECSDSELAAVRRALLGALVRVRQLRRAPGRPRAGTAGG